MSGLSCLSKRLCNPFLSGPINEFRKIATLAFPFTKISFFATFLDFLRIHSDYYSPASEASREVANLTERNIHIPPYMVSKNLTVCL